MEFEGSTENVVFLRVVEIGASNRCGDIAKRRSGASRLLESTGLEHHEAGLAPAP